MKKLLPLACAAMLAACATKSNDIAPSYVSPVIYQNYTCEQLSIEAQTISARAAQAAGVQDKKAQNDVVATGIGIVVFWPTLFFIEGDGAASAEVARLKGEMQAIEAASKQKNCNLQFTQ